MLINSVCVWCCVCCWFGVASSRFALYNVLGAVIWSVLFVGAGFFFGNLPFVQVRARLSHPFADLGCTGAGHRGMRCLTASTPRAEELHAGGAGHRGGQRGARRHRAAPGPQGGGGGAAAQRHGLNGLNAPRWARFASNFSGKKEGAAHTAPVQMAEAEAALAAEASNGSAQREEDALKDVHVSLDEARDFLFTSLRSLERFSGEARATLELLQGRKPGDEWILLWQEQLHKGRLIMQQQQELWEQQAERMDAYVDSVRQLANELALNGPQLLRVRLPSRQVHALAAPHGE